MLIGALGHLISGGAVGQAHLFDAVSGDLLHTFDDPTPTQTDNFGISVAIDGNSVLVGAWQDGTHGPNVGQAHLFDAVTGNFLHTFDDPTLLLDGDHFGQSVAIQGANVLIGAPNDRTMSPMPESFHIGQAHLFGVPEPSTAATMALGLAGLAALVLRRRLRKPAIAIVAVLGASQSADAATMYALSLSGDVTGTGMMVLKDGALDVDGVYNLSDVLESFELTVDAMPAKGELRATPPVTFLTESLVMPEMLQAQVSNGALVGVDIAAIAAALAAVNAIEHNLTDKDAAQKFEANAFKFQVDSASQPFFRCDPRVEDCRATLLATPVPEPSSGVLLAGMMCLVLTVIGYRTINSGTRMRG